MKEAKFDYKTYKSGDGRGDVFDALTLTTIGMDYIINEEEENQLRIMTSMLYLNDDDQENLSDTLHVHSSDCRTTEGILVNAVLVQWPYA